MLFFMVLVIGLEPIRSFPRGILSPLRLPIPPHQHLEAPPRFELGMKVLQTSALPLGYGAKVLKCQVQTSNCTWHLHGAGNEIRTRDICLGTATLYR